MMKKTLLAIFALCLSGVAVSQAQNTLPDELKGNWINEETNLWELSLWDDFAVAYNTFWNYNGIERAGGKGVGYVMNLKSADGEKAMSFLLKIENDSTIVRSLQAPKVRMIKATPGSLRRQFSTGDPTPFGPVEWKEDSVIIEGFMTDYDPLNPKNKDFTYLAPTFLDGKHTGYTPLPLNEHGQFRLVLPIYSTPQTLFCGKWLTVEAGDHLMVAFSYDQPNLFMGKNARINQENDELYPFRQIVNRWMPHMNTQDQTVTDAVQWKQNYLQHYRHTADSIDQFVKTHQLSEKWRQLALAETHSRVYSCLVNADYFFPNARIPEGFLFADKSYNYENRLAASINGGGYQPVVFRGVWELRNLFIADSLKLTTQELDVLKNASYYYKTDSALLFKLYREHPELGEIHRSKEVEAQNYRWYAESAAKLSNDPDIRDLGYANMLFSVWEQNQHILNEQELNKVLSYVTMPLIRERIRAKNAYFIALEEKSRNMPVNVGELTPGMRDPDSIFQAIVEPHKGKFVYIDIWGVWCGPCRGEMKRVAAMKKALEGIDIVYVYMANNSTPEAVQKVVAEDELTGENVIHYNLPAEQQTAFESVYLSGGYPTYILVDPKGKVVTKNAPRPSQAPLLRQEVDKLLEAGK